MKHLKPFIAYLDAQPALNEEENTRDFEIVERIVIEIRQEKTETKQFTSTPVDAQRRLEALRGEMNARIEEMKAENPDIMNVKIDYQLKG